MGLRIARGPGPLSPRRMLTRETDERLRSRQGFTLAELMVVLFILSILAWIVVPRIEVVKYRMDGSARGAVTTLLAAQRLAVQRQHDVAVAFDVAHDRFRIHEDGNNNGRVDPGERVRYVTLQSGVRFGLGSALALGSAESVVSFDTGEDGLPVVRFLRDGSASQEGTFYLTSTRGPGDSRFAGDSRAIQVNRATGRVTWFHYDPTGWKVGF
jgi:prepilin-type N-terminal cleavage/methylation domain-containing protein